MSFPLSLLACFGVGTAGTVAFRARVSTSNQPSRPHIVAAVVAYRHNQTDKIGPDSHKRWLTAARMNNHRHPLIGGHLGEFG